MTDVFVSQCHRHNNYACVINLRLTVTVMNFLLRNIENILICNCFSNVCLNGVIFNTRFTVSKEIPFN